MKDGLHRSVFLSLVGKAFRCTDGLVRWVTHLSVRNYYSMLWLDERTNVWHDGGIIKADRWQGGEEVPVPTTWLQAGATGIVSERKSEA